MSASSICYDFLVREIEKSIRLTDAERKIVTDSFIKLWNTTRVTKEGLAIYAQRVSTAILGERKRLAGKNKPRRLEHLEPAFNMEEYQKKEMFAEDTEQTTLKLANTNEQKSDVDSVRVVNFLGINNGLIMRFLTNPSSFFTYRYIGLSSDYRDVSNEKSNNITKFTWNIATSTTVQVGVCNTALPLENIKGMRLYQPYVPYVAAMNSASKRVSLMIEEFRFDSFNGPANSKFHFIYRPVYSSGQTSIELSTDDYNDSLYSFREPIKTINSLTLVFKDPVNTIAFATPFDKFVIVIEFLCLNGDYNKIQDMVAGI